MTPEEREPLNTFLQQLTEARAGQKDAEAEALIWAAVKRQPDAPYLLVQRAMGLEYALQASQAEVAKMQAELEQLRARASATGAPSTGGSFLGGWGRPAQAQAPAAPAAKTPVHSAPAGGQPAAAGAKPASSWGSGMLGALAGAAVGVAAGSFLSQGTHGFGHRGAAPAADADKKAAAEPEPLPRETSLAGNDTWEEEPEDESEDLAQDDGDEGSDEESA